MSKNTDKELQKHYNWSFVLAMVIGLVILDGIVYYLVQSNLSLTLKISLIAILVVAFIVTFVVVAVLKNKKYAEANDNLDSKDTKMLHVQVEVPPMMVDTPDGPREVILRVRHLKQFFKFASGDLKYNKAVHDISFDIYRGEVFGLVGESGCGKTTTGRSIIKLYNITSGDIYFKGVRVSAGTRWNAKEIKFSRIRAANRIKELDSEMNFAIHAAQVEMDEELALLKDASKEEYDAAKAQARQKYEEKVAVIKKDKAEKEAQIRLELAEIVEKQRKEIKAARFDQKNCDKVYAERCVKATKEAYEKRFKEFLDEHGPVSKMSPSDLKMYRKLRKQYKKALKFAKSERIMTKMQMIFQDPIASLDPRMTVREIIAEGYHIRGIRDKKFIEKKVNEVLKMVGLVPEHATRYPHEFSGGQRQRIGIARALIMNPEFIIADEPISALDVSIQAQVINLLNNLRNDLGLTILFVAHDLSVVKYFCDRIAVMYYGRIMELATSDELFKHPLHPYTKSLLSAIPHPDPDFEKNRRRVTYDPSTAHDYSEQLPTMREVCPGHFILCNDEEFLRYQEEIKD